MTVPVPVAVTVADMAKKRGRPPGKAGTLKKDSGRYDPNVCTSKPLPRPPSILPDVTLNPQRMTRNEEKALVWIIAYYKRNGWSPSTVELSHLMKVTPATATHYFQVLHLKGHVVNGGTRQCVPVQLRNHIQSFNYMPQDEDRRAGNYDYE